MAKTLPVMITGQLLYADDKMGRGSGRDNEIGFVRIECVIDTIII